MEHEPRMQWVPDEYEDKEYEGGAIITLSAFLLLLWFIFTSVLFNPVVLVLLAVATAAVLPIACGLILDAQRFSRGRVARAPLRPTSSRDDVEHAMRLLTSRMTGHRMRRSMRQLYRLSELDVLLRGKELRESMNFIIQGHPKELWIRVGSEAIPTIPILDAMFSGLVEPPLAMSPPEGATFKAR